MTASCSNSDGDSDVTATPGRTDGPAITLADGPSFTGEDVDDALTTIAPGDFNGDGEMDLALGAASADGTDGPDAGKVYVFYSVAGYTASEVPVTVADAVFVGLAGDQAGRSLAAADLNGDRVDDLIIGAPAADGEGRADVGKVYILVGNPVFEEVRATELAGNEPATTGADSGDFFGYTLTTGDFNDDGLADLAMGAFLADGPSNEREDAGEVHVVFGGDPPANLDLATKTLDATIFGARAGDRLGEALAAGDFDGDRRDDLIAAAPFFDSDDAENIGRTYILTDELSENIDLADGAPGSSVIGIDSGDQLGHSLAAPDFNGDSIDDLLLGAVSADGFENADDLAGEVALVLGSTDPPDIFEAARDASIIYGVAGGRLGRAVARGDLNGDGFEDVLLGASEAPDDKGEPEAGAAYVIFGTAIGTLPASTDDVALSVYGAAHDNLGTQVNGIPALAAVDLNDDGLADVVAASPRADENRGRVGVMFAERKR